MDRKSDSDTNCNWYVWYSHQILGTWSRELGNKRTSGNHLNYSIVEIDQNTKKSPGNLRGLAVIQTFTGKPSANPDVKNSQRI